jgi:hypothetical protein
MAIDVAAIDDLILGRGVKRGRHALPTEAVETFLERLDANGFRLLGVGEIAIEVGQRVPGWVLRGNVADFGTVFWEVFTPRAKRKLFGSEVRNEKGDWEIQLYPTSKEKVRANPDLVESYDASRPIGIY